MNTEVYSRSWFDNNKNQVSYIVFFFNIYIYMVNLADVAFMQILFFVLFLSFLHLVLKCFWL